MRGNKNWILGWLIPAVAAVVVAGALLAWQWPRIAGPAENTAPAPITLDALQRTDRVSTADHVRLTAEHRGNELVTTLVIDDHWHVNANPASLDFLIPTTVTAATNGKTLPLTVAYPDGHIIDVGLEKPIAVYSGDVEISSDLLSGATETAPIKVTVQAQACNDSGRCLVPSTLRTLTIAAEHP